MSHYSDDPDDEPSGRSIWWWVFCMPGFVVLWLEYMFPKSGNVFGSGRRLHNPIVQFYYTIGVYTFLFIIVVSLFTPGSPMRGGKHF